MTIRKETRQYLIAIAVFFFLALALSIGVEVADAAQSRRDPIITDSLQKSKPKCGKDCQKLNDVYFQNDGFTDYFINDSDGGKDSVFTVYHGVPMPTAGEGVRCDIVAKFEAEGIAMFGVCPGPQIVAMGSASQSNTDKGE